jgi:hypothetical protein
MLGEYFTVMSERGERVQDCGTDALFHLIMGLNPVDNTFFVIDPVDPESNWNVTVAIDERGGYEVDRCDPRYREHDVRSTREPSRLALELTLWLAVRDYPRLPIRND